MSELLLCYHLQLCGVQYLAKQNERSVFELQVRELLVIEVRHIHRFANTKLVKGVALHPNLFRAMKDFFFMEKTL